MTQCIMPMPVVLLRYPTCKLSSGEGDGVLKHFAHCILEPF